MKDRKDWQEFKDSTLKLIKKLESELKPDVEQIKFLYKCIESELPF